MPKDEKKIEKEYYGAGGMIWELIKIVLLAALVVVPIRIFLFQPFFVQGSSMEPNFEDKEYLIISEFGYKRTDVGFSYQDRDINFFTVEPFKKLERGDVAVFRYPKNPSQFFIKRIIALPGERIEIKDGRIKIYNSENPNGFVLEENYLSPSEETPGEVIFNLTDNQYFVMGDNRKYSSDSRSWGPLLKDDIIGKVLLRAWPLSRAKIF